MNFEAKIGVVLLIPPLSSVLIFFAMSDMDECFYYDYRSDSIVASNTPLYLGLMAIAGAEVNIYFQYFYVYFFSHLVTKE